MYDNRKILAFDNQAEHFGFKLHHFQGSPYGRTYYNFDYGITLTVNAETNIFQLHYVITQGGFIYFLKSESCSPFYEETPQKYKQFEKIFNSFLQLINKLD